MGAQKEQDYETNSTGTNNSSTHGQGKGRQMCAVAAGANSEFNLGQEQR